MRIYRRTLYFISAAAFTALYAATLQTSVQAADSGELQLVALTFGIAHPPGYPLWSILAGLFARLPGIAPLTGVSLFSLVTAGATLLFVAHTIEMVIAQQGPVSRRATLAGLAAAAALGVGSTFWAQATSANIRSLTALFAALLAWSAGRSYSGRSATLVLALVLGLGVAHHPSLAFPGLVVAVYVLFRELRDHSVQRSARIRRLAGFAVIAVLSQVVWLYLPLRDVAGAAFAPGSLRSLGGFLDHALARGFGGDMFWFLLVEPQRLVDRLLLLPSLTTFVFGEVIAILIAISILSSLVHRFELSLVLVTAACVHLFVTMTYRAPQTVEYALPAWVIAAVLLGVGAGAVTERLRSIPSYVVIGAVVLVGQARWSSFARHAHDFFVQDRADAILRAAPVDGFVLAQWHEATPLWVRQESAYPQSARVEYVAPQGAQPYAETFAARAHALAPQAVWVTSLFEDEFVRVGLRSMPVGGVAAWQVTPASPSAALPGEDAVRFDERIDVWLAAEAPRTAEPGALLPLDIAWQLDGDVQDGDALTVRVFRRDGRLAATADVSLTAADSSGVRRRFIALPLDLEPGEYSWMVGAYRAGAAGFTQYRDAADHEFVDVGTVRLTAAPWPPATRRALADRCLLHCATPALIGVDYDLGLPGRVRLWTHFRSGVTAADIEVLDSAGRAVASPRMVAAADGFQSLAFEIPPMRALQLRVGDVVLALPDYLDGERYVPFGNRMALTSLAAHRRGSEWLIDIEWLAARPIAEDYAVSVRFDGGAHDGIPSLGALPTLKWMRGSRIFDRHPIPVSGNTPTQGVVLIYDSTSRAELPPLDERYEGRFTFTVP